MVMSLKQREIKIEPRIKLNHKKYIKALLRTFGCLRVRASSEAKDECRVESDFSCNKWEKNCN